MESPVTFEALSFALLDEEQNAVLTTVHGNLAIFSTKGMAEVWANSSRKKIKVIPVVTKPVTEQ